MRARAIASGVVASAAVLTVAWQIGAAQVTASQSTTTPTTNASGSGSASSGSSGSGSSAATPSSTPSSSASPSAGSSGASSTSKSSISGTFAGTTAETQFGPMQVEIVVASGKITDVKVLQETDQGGRSTEISNMATPTLRTEALSAQSADIQSVSGATYTSEGYVTSLQAAIDKAGL